MVLLQFFLYKILPIDILFGRNVSVIIAWKPQVITIEAIAIIFLLLNFKRTKSLFKDHRYRCRVPRARPAQT